MRKIVSLLFLSIITIGSSAQEIVGQEFLAKEDSIFNVKISEEAHYAEVTIDYITKDDKDVNATEMESRRLLQAHIIEIFSKCFNMSNNDVQEIWDVIDDKCQNVEIKRGDLLSVFSYITKDAFKGLFGRKKMKPLTPKDSLILFGPKEKIGQLKIETQVTEEVKIETVIDKEEVVEEKNVKEVKDSVEVKDTIEVKNKNTETKLEEKLEVKPEEKAKITEQQEVVIPDLCQKMITMENFQTLMNFLNQEKTYGNLFFGSLNGMQKPEKCYVVILKKTTGKIVAVLNKGESNRMNFMTHKQDCHNNYTREEYRKIFVQELNK